ncbi:histone-lysine N-methyltransferase SETMAR [Trichonephila clavipes]|nr:histone-lysine N-methyltransferase SETMAR [Trichonephila clavipes]
MQNFNQIAVIDVIRSERLVKADKDIVKVPIGANQEITTREFTERLNLLNLTNHDHLKRLSLISKLDIWITPVLIETNLCCCIDVCELFLKFQENFPVLKRINTGKDKCVV